MAQMLPGAVVVIAFTCMTVGNGLESYPCIKQMLDNIETFWFRSTFAIFAFLFVSVAVGMLIHGLNWTVLACIENRGGVKDPKAVRDTKYHKWSFWRQLLLSPCIMAYEILVLVVTAKNIEQLTMDENISWIKSEHIQQFQFLEDFYLHFGQFYAHMAYALLTTLILAIVCCFRKPSFGLFALVLGFYLLSGVFFLLGRIQLSSLFKAETTLREQSKPTVGGR